MKKTVLLLLIVVSFGYLNAQVSNETSSPGKIFIGVKAGYGIVNYEPIIKTEEDSTKMTFDNFSFGILAGYKLGSRISFQIEGNFAKYGASHINPIYIYSPQSPLLVNYGLISTFDHVDMDIFSIDVPLTVKYSLKEGMFSPFLYCGVNYGINILGRASIVRRITNGDVIDYITSTDDITARIIFDEFAPVIGAGIKMDISRVTFLVDIRYKYGFKNLSNVDNNSGFTNNALWVSTGMVFSL
jgi:hypothetical protein